MSPRVLSLAAVLALILAGCGAPAPKAVRDDHDRDHDHEAAEAHADSTTISAEAALAGGVKVETAGPARLVETLDLSGRVEVTPEGKSEVRAWYPGRIMAMTPALGQAVRKGQIVARVESSQSLQTYPIPAPISGVVVQKNANVGDVAYDQPLYVIADPTRLHAEFFLYPRDAERVHAGQVVEVRNLAGAGRTRGTVVLVSPTADLASQTLVAHVTLPGASVSFRPGMAVEGSLEIASTEVPVAVKSIALQRMDARQVVFVRTGDVYEARPVTLGRRSADWVEVLSGLKAGETYVAEGAFLIRADIEKAGAAHEH